MHGFPHGILHLALKIPARRVGPRRRAQKRGGIFKAQSGIMKTISKIVLAIGISSLGTWNALSDPSVTVHIGGPPVPPPPPPVTVQVPPPAPPVEVVPEDYVWDGDEYVGVVGDQYYYLGPGNVWLIMDTHRMHRFLHWEKHHPDWREHAIRNENYRGHHDYDRDYDHHGHDYDH